MPPSPRGESFGAAQMKGICALVLSEEGMSPCWAGGSFSLLAILMEDVLRRCLPSFSTNT